MQKGLVVHMVSIKGALMWRTMREELAVNTAMLTL